jgi:hypothetical protein
MVESNHTTCLRPDELFACLCVNVDDDVIQTLFVTLLLENDFNLTFKRGPRFKYVVVRAVNRTIFAFSQGRPRFVMDRPKLKSTSILS